MENWSTEDLELLSEAFAVGSEYIRASREKTPQEPPKEEPRIIPVSDMGQGLKALASRAQRRGHR